MTALVNVFVIAWMLGWATTACAILEHEAGATSWEREVPGLTMLFFVWPVVA